jgi:PAS domain-containing protein
LELQEQPRKQATSRSWQATGIFDASMLGIAVFDKQHRFVAVNKRLAALHGIAAKDHIDTFLGVKNMIY